MKYLLTLFSLIILIGIFVVSSHLSQSDGQNLIQNSNIWWSSGWNPTKNGEEATRQGNSFRFGIKGGRSLSVHARTKETNGLETLLIIIDGKEYLLQNPNLSDKTLTIALNNSATDVHNVIGIFYCYYGLSKCHTTLDSIKLDGGTILKPGGVPDKTLGVLGDSISLEEQRLNYASIVANSLQYNLYNASYWGRTAGREHGVAPAVDNYKALITQNPSIIVLFLGHNDVSFGASEENFRRDYATIVDNLHKALPKTRIISIGILPRRSSSDVSGKIVTFNQIIKDIASEHNIHFLDTSALLTEDDYNDQVHPNVLGQMKLGELLSTFIKNNKLADN